MSVENFVNALSDYDEYLSSYLVVAQEYKEIMKVVEFIFHGAVWIGGTSLFLLTAYGRHFDEDVQYHLVVLLCGLIVDLILTGLIKLSIHRDRPKENTKNAEMFMAAPVVDAFSFPSGHTTRAALIISILTTLYPDTTRLSWIIPFTVGYSRVALGRHYIADALGGILLGYIFGKFSCLLPPSANVFLRKILR